MTRRSNRSTPAGPAPLETRNLRLVVQTPEDVRAQLARMPPQERAQVSPAWAALLEGSRQTNPWIHGFKIVSRASNSLVGHCGFKGPPDLGGVVEIAYGIDPEQQGKGYATEAATALIQYALGTGQVRVVRAHTLPHSSASTRVLTKCGFEKIGEVIDPDDGLVWRWELGADRSEKSKVEGRPV